MFIQGFNTPARSQLVGARPANRISNAGRRRSQADVDERTQLQCLVELRTPHLISFFFQRIVQCPSLRTTGKRSGFSMGFICYDIQTR